MDTEQIKLIIEAVRGVADGATSIVLVWLVLDYLVRLAAPLVIGGTLVWITSLVVKGFSIYNQQAQIIRAIANKMGTTFYGYTSDYADLQKLIHKTNFTRD